MKADSKQELRYEPRNHVKSFKAWQQFIAYSRAGEDIAYRTPEGDICSPARVKKLINAQVLAALQEVESRQLKLQTYKMHENAEDILIERDDAVAAIEDIKKEYL